MNLTTSKILYNQYTIKRYGPDYYKLILHKRGLVPPGYERPQPKVRVPVDPNFVAKTLDTVSKLDNNVSRARSKIWEYAMCNDFEYFVTFTLDKKKKDRYDLDAFISTLSRFIRNQRALTGFDIQYLLVPERHQDSAWHMHGLMKGIDPKDLNPFSLSDNIPYKIKEKIKAGREVYDYPKVASRFGFVTVEKIRSLEGVAGYMTKYINKNVGLSVEELGAKSYYASRGLKKAEIIKKGTFPTQLRKEFNFDFENDYVCIHKIKNDEFFNIISQLSDE